MSPGRRAPLTYRWARRIAVAMVGGTVLAIGLALIVLPGPAFVVIPLGLAILGAEFAWARHWLRKVKQRSVDLIERFRGNSSR
ncbi:MAG: PGPGW domain-containing protein [Steroidobacteraceae bacterium]|nr:PGPGW domain-containing protein [Steroidobacteraceae bacterium]